MARCPECGQKLTLKAGLKRWDHIYCESCHAELEVLNALPLELEAVFDFEDEELISDLDDEPDDETEEDDIDWGGDEDDEEDEEEDDDDDDDEEEW